MIAWVCPLLKTYMVTPKEYVYFEGDEIINIQFMKNGSCGFVLPKYNNIKYINITKGCEFGAEDIIGSILKHEFAEDDDWIQQKDRMIR